MLCLIFDEFSNRVLLDVSGILMWTELTYIIHSFAETETENEMDLVKMARGRWRVFYSTLLSNQRKILKIYLWFHAVAQSHT